MTHARIWILVVEYVWNITIKLRITKIFVNKILRCNLILNGTAMLLFFVIVVRWLGKLFERLSQKICTIISLRVVWYFHVPKCVIFRLLFFFLVIFEIFVEDLNLFGQRSNLLIAYSKLSLGDFQQLLACFSLTFSRTLSRCCCLATRLTNSFYFLESFRIAINRSIERTKFVLPRNLSSFGERAGARSCISRVSFSLRFDKPPRFQVTDLLSISRCMGLRGT